mgnify:CR=1 FL=1
MRRKDLTEIEQVAVYHDNKISPYNFTTKLLDILQQWGSPPALIERNNCGAQVVDALRNVHGYENIVNFAPSKNQAIDSKSGLGLGTFIGKTLLERMKANVKFDKCPKINGAMVTIKWQTKDLLAI